MIRPGSIGRTPLAMAMAGRTSSAARILKGFSCQIRGSIMAAMHVLAVSAILLWTKLELVKKLELAAYRFAEFPVHHYHRAFGKSQFFNFTRLLKTAFNIMHLWFDIMVKRGLVKDVAYKQEAPVNFGLTMHEKGRG